MDRIVNRELIEFWINTNGPYGAEKLAVKAQVSYATVGLVRRGKVPTKAIRTRIAAGTGLIEDELFPVAATIESKAS